MNIELHCDPLRSRVWIANAVQALTAAGHTVALRWMDGATPPAPKLRWLLAIEKWFLQRGAGGADMIARDAIPSRASAASPDVIIDFTDAPIDRMSLTTRHLRPCFNGEPGENAALTAILGGDLPVIDLIDERSGALIDRGHPSSEIAAGLGGALDTVMIRTVTLLLANLDGAARPPLHLAASTRRRELGTATRYVVTGIAKHLLRKLYRAVCYAPHWHIGWRFVGDNDVWARRNLGGQPWQRLPERPHCFAADPFVATWQGRTFVLFEELDHRVGKGYIAAIEFNETGPVGDISTVLEEPWHLSYPFLIEDGGELWMIPECSSTREVILYRCRKFPDQWERHATLLSDVELGDATIVRHEGRYYLFGVTRDGSGGYSDTLSIYHADRLTGPWQPHAQNPVLLDRASARPAGHFVEQDGRLWRPVQDCSEGYGAAVALAEIVKLSPTEFEQIVRTRLAPSADWPGRKLHTLNRSGRLEVIDGSRVQPKIMSYLGR